MSLSSFQKVTFKPSFPSDHLHTYSPPSCSVYGPLVAPATIPSFFSPFLFFCVPFAPLATRAPSPIRSRMASKTSHVPLAHQPPESGQRASGRRPTTHRTHISNQRDQLELTVDRRSHASDSARRTRGRRPVDQSSSTGLRQPGSKDWPATDALSWCAVENASQIDAHLFPPPHFPAAHHGRWSRASDATRCRG
ncbi:hypothetical protein BS50DRAFT_569693, partial [Corynespora cassiicola Philippines]